MTISIIVFQLLLFCSRAEQASRVSDVSWRLGLHERHNTSLHLSRRGKCAWSRVPAACEDRDPDDEEEAWPRCA